MTSADASDRAALAEESVRRRHLRRLRVWPSGRLGATSFPAGRGARWHKPFHYWWQAHLLDCLVDAEVRAPDEARRRLIRAFPRAMWVRNGFRWTNDYYDDIAWFGLALERAGRLGLGNPRGLRVIVDRLAGAWRRDVLGGLPWRVGDEFRNAPVMGPAAILFARVGEDLLARRAVDWLRTRLQREDGLVIDGLRPHRPALHTYNQGTLVGALVELGELAEADRVAIAVGAKLARDGVLVGARGGDGGLFAGITARHLGEAARAGSVAARSIVEASAEAAWANRAENADGVFLGHDWTVPAVIPTAAAPLGANQAPDGVTSAAVPERDLSVQLSGWMLLEAAARL